MPQENVEVVREVLEAWNAGDMERVRELYDPDVIVRSPRDWPEPGPFVGREAVFQQFSRIRSTWDSDSFDLMSDLLTAGDRVIVPVIWRVAGRGPQSDMEITLVYTVRKGLVFGLEIFWDHAEALEAAGLSQ